MYSVVGLTLFLWGADALTGDGNRLKTIRKASPATTDIRSLPVPSFTPGPDVPSILYGEESRIYRRTQYKGPGDWTSHRRPQRFFDVLDSIPRSGVIRSLSAEVGSVALVAAIVSLWNCAAVEDFGQLPIAIPSIGIPLAVFSLSISSLSLLLVFRTNASFSRWFEARGAWGRIINSSRNLVRQLVSWQPAVTADPAQRRADVLYAAAMTSACARTMQLHLQREAGKELDPEQFAAALLFPTALPLPEEEALIIGNAKNRPVAALTRATVALTKAAEHLEDKDYKHMEIDESITVLFDQLGVCERLYGSPVPLVYTRLTSRFTSVWLLLLPLALVSRSTLTVDFDHASHLLDSLMLIPECALIATFFFGIDELAIQLEEPFTILPLEFLCGGIDAALKEIVTTNMPVDTVAITNSEFIASPRPVTSTNPKLAAAMAAAIAAVTAAADAADSVDVAIANAKAQSLEK